MERIIGIDGKGHYIYESDADGRNIGMDGQKMIKVECIKSDVLYSAKVGEVYEAERSFFRWRVRLNNGKWISIPDERFYEYFVIL